MKIIFGCLGFASTDVFVEKDGRQLRIGIIFDMHGSQRIFDLSDFFIECYVKRNHYVEYDEIPSSQQILDEYEKQLKETGVSINRNILYAG